MHHATDHEDLDPRRRDRHSREGSMTATKVVAVPRLPELLASLLVRLGWIR